MEKQDLQKMVSELEQRVSELEGTHRRQKLYRRILIIGGVLYIIIALFAYGRLLSSISI